MLIVKNLAKTIRNEPLLENINFKLSSATKAALIGPNGCGKSTLLRMILQEVDTDAGTVILENEKLGYLPQEFNFPADQTTQQFIASITNDPAQNYRIDKILAHLGLDDYDPQQPMSALSEGQKMKFYLAKVLFDEPTILLLDEPTNHLDIEGVVWFELFIRDFPGAALMISHDRRFLDNTVDQIFEIDEHALHIFHGNYSDYKNQKLTWLKQRETTYKAQERKRKQLEKLLANARKIQDGKSRSRAVRSAKKRMEREVHAHEITAYEPYRVQGIEFKGNTHRQKLMLKVNELSFAYSNNESRSNQPKKVAKELERLDSNTLDSKGLKTNSTVSNSTERGSINKSKDVSNNPSDFNANPVALVLQNISFELRGSQRIWLYGPNGAGKTTLLNIITQHLSPTQGTAEIGPNVNWGYFQQNQQHLDLSQTVTEFIRAQTAIAHHQLFGFIEQLSFSKDYLDRRLGNLSPGERARLSLGLFTQQDYNLLILDEPTNYLDIWTKELVEQALQEYQGALLLVSHDRYFVENVGIHKMLNLNYSTFNVE